MYLDFYGLKEKPFTLSPNPKFLYYSPKHKEAISQFIFGVYEQSGFMALTGEVGTGKTILINALVKSLPKDHIIININHKILSTKGFVQNICKELNINFSKQTTAELFIALREYLKKTYNEGKKIILILDEAQNLSQTILEDVRLLSNFEAMHEKYLQILIVGQPELDKKLEDVNLRQLKERISLRYHLKNLNHKETGKYIKHRLEVAGYNSERNLFTADAIDYIYEQTEGIPRRINIICENALLMGYTINSQKIDATIIQKVDVTEISSEFADVGSYDNSNAEGEIGFNNLTENALTNLDINDSISQGQIDEPGDRTTLETNSKDIEVAVVQTPSLNEAGLESRDLDRNVPVSNPHAELPTAARFENEAPISPNQNHEFERSAAIEYQTPHVEDSVTPIQQAPMINQANVENKNVDATAPTFENKEPITNDSPAQTQQPPLTNKPIHESKTLETNVPLSHNHEFGNRTIFENQSPDPDASVMQSHQAPLPNQTNMEKKNSDIDLIVQHQREGLGNNRTFENPPSDINARHRTNRGHEVNDNTSFENNNNDINMSMPRNQFIESDKNGNFENNYPYSSDSRTRNQRQFYEPGNQGTFGYNNFHQASSFPEPENSSIKDAQIEKLIDIILNNMVIFQRPSTSKVIIGALVVFVLFILAFFLAFLLVGFF